MPTNFPTSLDALTNPAGTDDVSIVDHAAQHSDVNDATEALQAKVGVNSSAVTTSHDYKLGEVTGSDKAVSKTATQTLTNKTLTSPTLTTPALGTPTSGVMTNVTGTADGLTSGITKALKSATTTVDVSAATAPTSGQVLTATGTTSATWQNISGGYWDFAIKLANDFTVTNSSTFTDVTDFSFAVIAGEIWHIEIRGATSANDVTGDIKVILMTTGSFGRYQSFGEGYWYNGTGTGVNLVRGSPLPSTTVAVSAEPANQGDNVVRSLYMSAQVVVDWNGDIKLQIANQTAGAGRQSTLKAGTYMLARKLSS